MGSTEDMPIADRDVHRSRPPVVGTMPCHFRVPERDWIASRLDRLPSWPRGGRVLDAGCGPGAYVAGVRARVGDDGVVVGVDLNHERVASALATERSAFGARADVEALPFRDAAFDVALAMHMLYHVPDIAAGLAELRRVVRPGGALVVSTNSAHDEPEVTDLYLHAGGTDERAFGDWRFCMENAEEHLGAAFDIVERHVEESTLDVPAPEPVVAGLDSQRYMLESTLAAGVTWEAFLDGVRARTIDVIEERGLFRITCRTAIYVCR